jgi:hypothetical protein
MFLHIPIPLSKGGTGATDAAGARTSLGVSVSTAVMLLDGSNAMGADLAMGTHKITGLSDGTNATDAVTKQQLDAATQGARDVKDSCRVATTGSNITLAGSAPNTLDGVSLAANDRILVKDQTNAAQNGLYYVSTLGTGANGTWTRTTDADASSEVTAGLFTWVTEGTTNGDSGWLLSTDDVVTLGTTNLTFQQVSGLGQVTAGNGLTKTGNTLDIGQGTGITVNANDIQISALYTGQSSIVTVGTIGTGTWQGTKVDITYGGTNATTASAARSNLATAPNTPIYWLGSSNGELANGVVPSNGTGISVTASTGVIAVDTAVVATTNNSLTMSGKTLTSPTVNAPRIVHTPNAQTGSYTVVDADNLVSFLVSSGANATMSAISGHTIGHEIMILNRPDSSANVTVAVQTGEVLEGTTNGTFVLAPGDVTIVMKLTSTMFKLL